MLVHYDGTRTKLSADYSVGSSPRSEIDNSVQQSIQPVNQQAAPKLEPKNNEPAAGMQTGMGTPMIHNPTLQRMGIEMPAPRDPREVSTKLSNLRALIDKSQSPGLFNRVDSDLLQTLKGRDFYDSPYMTTRNRTRLALKSPEETRVSRFNKHLGGGAGALLGGLAPLVSRGITPGSILASGVTGTLGYLAGAKIMDAARKRKMEQYRYYLEGNPME